MVNSAHQIIRKYNHTLLSAKHLLMEKKEHFSNKTTNFMYMCTVFLALFITGQDDCAHAGRGGGVGGGGGILEG